MKRRIAAIGSIFMVIILTIFSFILGEDLLQEYNIPLPGNSTIPELPAADTDWYEIYFTDPACGPEETWVDGIDSYIVADILAAEARVDVAAFDLDLESIVNALISLEKAGIPVRVVTDEDNSELSSINRLRRNGISVVEDKRTGFMHNKFVVVDGRIVWTGSMNLTGSGAYCNNNHMVRIESPRLALNYTAEMDEMYTERLFGPDSPVNTANQNLIIGGVNVENYFGPEVEISPTLARTVARAEEEILFMAFAFTDERIGEAMLGRADAGVSVRGVFERSGAESGFSYYGIMAAAALPNMQVRQDGNPRIMHHKVIIIDRETVILGSFNFSESANSRNDENVLVVHDPTFASFFVEEFETVWNEAAP